MAIERPDWSAPAVPAAPSPQEVVNEMATQDAPSPATQSLVKSDTTTAPVPALERDASGRIIRPDWGPKTPTVYNRESKDKDRPDWNVPARGESGKFISKSADAVRSQWENEGGFQANVARVQAVEQSMLAFSENPAALQASMNELPNSIALKCADMMRLTTSYGPNGGVRKLEMLDDALSPAERTQFREWFNKLSEGDQLALIAGFVR